MAFFLFRSSLKLCLRVGGKLPMDRTKGRGWDQDIAGFISMLLNFHDADRK